MPSRRTETARKSPTVSPMILALSLAAIAWIGWWYVANNVRPTLPDGQPSLVARAAFLATWAIALMGTAWPVLLAIHRRFWGEPLPWTIWRQSAWVAVLGAAVAWLQMNHWLNLALAAILAGVFIVIELILLVRARQETRDRDVRG